MTTKIFTLILASLLIISCDDKTKQQPADQQPVESTNISAIEQAPTPASESEPESEPSQSIEQTMDENTRQAYAQSEKMNLWLSVFNYDYGYFGRKLNKNVKNTSTLINLDQKAKKVLQNCGEKNNACTLKAIKKDPLKNFSLVLNLSLPSEKLLHNYKLLIDELEKSEPRLLELDIEGKKFAENYVKLALVLHELQKYALNGEYQSDNYQKAPNLFNQLANSYNEFMQTQHSAKLIYNKLYNEIHDIQKLDFKKRGLTLQYDCMEIMDITKEIVGLINNTFDEKNNFKNLDTQDIELKIQQIVDISDNLKKYKGNDSVIKTQGLNRIYYDGFVDYLPKMITQIKLVLNKLDDKDVNQEIKSLNTTENSLIQLYNNSTN